ATERIDALLDNEPLTVKPMEEVDLIVFRKTQIGFQTIINNKHIGLLHFNDVYRDIHIGDRFKGFIKNILPGNKIDVAAGKSGFKRVEDEAQKIIRLLNEHGGFLPYHDKSNPEEIYSFFSMSKKTFKMTVGGLYKNKRIRLEENGIRLNE
ncbi:MAG: RNA-binding protein, partial [Saprospiraceae bacterium]